AIFGRHQAEAVFYTPDVLFPGIAPLGYGLGAHDEYLTPIPRACRVQSAPPIRAGRHIVAGRLARLQVIRLPVYCHAALGTRFDATLRCTVRFPRVLRPGFGISASRRAR